MRKIVLCILLMRASCLCFGHDSTYVVAEFGFKILSQTGLTKQNPFPYSQNSYDHCPEYGYCEGKDSNEKYIGEIRILDCRKLFANKSAESISTIVKAYYKEACESHYGGLDSSRTYKNSFCLIGVGDFIKKRGEKKEAYKYMVIAHGDFIYTLTVMDIKKNVPASFEDLLKRFDFTD